MQNGNIWVQATGRDSVPLVTVPGHLGTPRLREEDAKGRWGPTPGHAWGIRQRRGAHQEPGWEPRSGRSPVLGPGGEGSEPGWSRA